MPRRSQEELSVAAADVDDGDKTEEHDLDKRSKHNMLSRPK